LLGVQHLPPGRGDAVGDVREDKHVEAPGEEAVA